jgi:sugar fermentation stimulation protein A
MSLIFEVEEMLFASVINRPSKEIKSPYLADILIDDKVELAHSPSLGCKGLIATDSIIFVSPKYNTKSKYSIDIVIEENDLVGVNPLYANYMVYNMINNNLIENLINMTSIKKEVTIGDSRFDIVCKKNNKKFIIEVKNVPLVDSDNIAIFPDGFRKSKNVPISPRAIKHIEELEKNVCDSTECMIIFVVQRLNCTKFRPSDVDIFFKNALKKAYKNGVQVKAYQVNWNDNKAYFDKELEVLL